MGPNWVSPWGLVDSFQERIVCVRVHDMWKSLLFYNQLRLSPVTMELPSSTPSLVLEGHTCTSHTPQRDQKITGKLDLGSRRVGMEVCPQTPISQSSPIPIPPLFVLPALPHIVILKVLPHILFPNPNDNLDVQITIVIADNFESRQSVRFEEVAECQRTTITCKPVKKCNRKRSGSNRYEFNK